MKLSDGLFHDVFYEISREYPGIEAEDKIVDNVAMQLVMHPETFDRNSDRKSVWRYSVGSYQRAHRRTGSSALQQYGERTLPCLRQFTAAPPISQERELPIPLHFVVRLHDVRASGKAGDFCKNRRAVDEVLKDGTILNAGSGRMRWNGSIYKGNYRTPVSFGGINSHGFLTVY